MVSRGIFSADDWLKLGKTIDELSKFCYVVTYTSRRDLLVVTLRKEDKDKLSKFNVLELKESNALIFAKIKWR